MSAGDRSGMLERASRRGMLLILLVVVLTGALAVASFGAVAAGTSAQTDGNESSAPELHSGEKLNTTAVELLLIDDAGIQISSIDADDFLLSDGDISHVRASESGTNATATLVLAEPIPEDELLVGITTGSDIRNVNGTVIRPEEAESVTVTGMDGVSPGVLGTDVSDAVGGPAEIAFRFEESLSEIHVEITGPENVTLSIEDFENPGSNRYVATYSPPESGEYKIALQSATDVAGNSGNISVVRTIDADRSQPEAVIGIDFGSSSGTNVTFDATQSSGNRLNYTWDFGDGTTERGERISHEFTPENHTVTLTVEDEFGNTDVDRLDLNLTDGFASGENVVPENQTAAPVVIIDRDSATESRSSLVSVTGALADNRLDIGTVDDSEPPLLSRDAIELDQLSISPTVNTSFSVALSAVGAGGVGDAIDEESTGVGGFTVLSDIRPAEMSRAEFTFSIDTQRLATLDLSPEEIELRREVGEEWVRLDTSIVNESDDRYQFAATAPGFSRFAIVATTVPAEETNTSDETDSSDGSASIQVTDASLDRTEVQPGDTVQVTASVENSGERNGSFQAGLELDGTVVETTGIEVGAGESRTVTFSPQLDEPGTVAVAVNGTTAGEVTVQETDGNESDDEDELDVNEDVFTVRNVTLSQSSIGPGENVTIEGDVLNEGEEIADFIAELEVDGEVVDTFEVPKVPAGEDIPVSFTRQFNETGTYNISISGTESESELAVGQDSGFFSFLSFLPLGFLPLGLLQTGITFVGVPLLFVYLVLKALAFYLGY